MEKSIETVDKELCFGCTACSSICSNSAIEMKMNREGFYFPVLDRYKCTNCGMCTDACPTINRWSNESKIENTIYAFQNIDSIVLSHSTSGGLFSAIAGCYQGAYIAGAVYEDKQVKHILSNKQSDIDRMRGSKYVQSYMGNVFGEVKDKLEAGFYVIFSGTSCYVDALNKYLRSVRVNTDKLITLDLICHGVPSPGVYSSFVEYYEKRHHINFCNHFFRSKKYGWGIEKGAANYLQTIQDTQEKQITDFDVNLWQNIFFCDYCTRESCYTCPYTSINKPSDITMGDFWNIKSIIPSLKETSLGYSLAIAHTKKGTQILNELNAIKIDSEKNELIVKMQPRLNNPIKKPYNRDEFWKDYREMDFNHLANKYYRYSTLNKIIYKLWILSNKLGTKKISTRLAIRLFI